MRRACVTHANGEHFMDKLIKVDVRKNSDRNIRETLKVLRHEMTDRTNQKGAWGFCIALESFSTVYGEGEPRVSPQKKEEDFHKGFESAKGWIKRHIERNVNDNFVVIGDQVEDLNVEKQFLHYRSRVVTDCDGIHQGPLVFVEILNREMDQPEIRKALEWTVGLKTLDFLKKHSFEEYDKQNEVQTIEYHVISKTGYYDVKFPKANEVHPEVQKAIDAEVKTSLEEVQNKAIEKLCYDIIGYDRFIGEE